MSEYRTVIEIPMTTLEQIERYLTVEPQSPEEALSEDEKFSFTASFENGYQVDVECCGVQYNEMEDTNLAWTQAVLFDPNGYEISFTEPEDTILGFWELENGDDLYIVEVIGAEF